MARYLVTGGAGFVGANLIRHLIGKGNVSALVHPADDLWRLGDIKNKISIAKVDLADFQAVKRVMQKVKPDTIFHLAAAGTYPSQKDFRMIFNANTLGTANLLEALESVPYRAFVMTGSSSEYGYKSKAMRESDVLEPNSFYSATKGGATLIAQSFASVLGRPTVILRLFSIYGPWEEPGRFIPTAIANCIKNKPIKLTAGSEVRDFVYIDDAVDAMVLGAKKAKQLKGKIFNIGSGKQTLLTEAARQATVVTKSTSKIDQGAYPARPWDAVTWRADTSAAKKILGWRAKTTIKEGLSKTAEWMKEHMEYYQ